MNTKKSENLQIWWCFILPPQKQYHTVSFVYLKNCRRAMQPWFLKQSVEKFEYKMRFWLRRRCNAPEISIYNVHYTWEIKDKLITVQQHLETWTYAPQKLFYLFELISFEPLIKDQYVVRLLKLYDPKNTYWWNELNWTTKLDLLREIGEQSHFIHNRISWVDLLQQAEYRAFHCHRHFRRYIYMVYYRFELNWRFMFLFD